MENPNTHKRKRQRKRAYHYIVEATKGTGVPLIDSDERLADVFDISLDEIKSLKEGLSDPSTKLVHEFKKWHGLMIYEHEVDSYLVTPFLTNF